MAWLLFTMFIIDNMCHVMIGVGVVHTIGFEINFFCFDCVRFLDQCNNYEDGIFNSECILKNWAIPGLFLLYFRLFNTVDSKQMFDKSLLMTGFEPRISGVGGDRATTELQPLPNSVFFTNFIMSNAN